MKVFVYSKKDNSTIAIFIGVVQVYYLQDGEKQYIRIVTEDGEFVDYDRRFVKTRIYQN